MKHEESMHRIVDNAQSILRETQDPKRIAGLIKIDGARMFMNNKATPEDIEIMASRALALFCCINLTKEKPDT